MTSIICPSCALINGKVANENVNNQSSPIILQRTYCTPCIPDQVVSFLKKVFQTSIEKLVVPWLKITVTDKELTAIVASIFDEDVYDRHTICLAAYIQSVKAIATFFCDKALNAVKGITSTGSPIVFRIVYDELLSLLTLKTVENNKEFTLSGKFPIKLIGVSPLLSSSSSSNVDNIDTVKPFKRSKSLDEMSNERMRIESIVNYLDNGSDDYIVVKDDKWFEPLERFNDIFIQHLKRTKRYKGYAVRSSDKPLLHDRGFEWMNIKICSDCIQNRRKDCGCNKEKFKIPIINRLRITPRDILINTNTTTTIITEENMEQTLQKYLDLSSDNFFNDLKKKKPTFSSNFSDSENSDEENDHHNNRVNEQGSSLKRKRDIEDEVDEVVVIPPIITLQGEEEPKQGGGPLFKCTFPGCSYETTRKEYLSKHGKYGIKNVPHMTRAQIKEVYPDPRVVKRHKTTV